MCTSLQQNAGSALANFEDIQATYDGIAPTYEKYAALESEVGRRLLERVKFGRADPGVVLDLGCGSGLCAADLKKDLRKVNVIGLDASGGMLAEARRKSTLTRPLRWINADMTALPVARHSIDLAVSNLSIPQLDGFGELFDEVRRVLKPDGMFLFSTLGPASFAQVYGAMDGLDQPFDRASLPDVLVAGDALTAAGFREPVMDVDFLTVHYPAVSALFRELEMTGASLLFPDWSSVREKLAELESSWTTLEGGGRYPLDYEVIYGAAFGPPEGQPRRTKDGEIATFSVDSLVKTRNLGYD